MTTPSPRSRSAAAGAVAALAWAALEPLDRRLFRCRYSDVELLGKAFTRGPLWPLFGLAAHMANGAGFGLAFHEVQRRTGLPKRPLVFGLALTEHVALYPLSALTDRYHPARDELPALARNPRAFAQATVRHAVFGLVLGRLA